MIVPDVVMIMVNFPTFCVLIAFPVVGRIRKLVNIIVLVTWCVSPYAKRLVDTELNSHNQEGFVGSRIEETSSYSVKILMLSGCNVRLTNVKILRSPPCWPPISIDGLDGAEIR